MIVQGPNSSCSYILLNKVLLTNVPFILYLLLYYNIRIYYQSCNTDNMTDKTHDFTIWIILGKKPKPKPKIGLSMNYGTILWNLKRRNRSDRADKNNKTK